VHNLAAFQNAFRARAEHLVADGPFVAHLAPRLRTARLAVASPDPGGVKRAERFAQRLRATLGADVPMAFMEKQRSEGVVSGEALVGEVRGRVVIIVDDLISTGTTMLRAARVCHDAGAERVLALATHGLFVGDADRVVGDPLLEQVLVTDSVPPFRLDPLVAERKLSVVETAPLVAEAIRRIHTGGSLVELLEHGP